MNQFSLSVEKENSRVCRFSMFTFLSMLVLAFLFLGSQSASAQSSKITGRITDDKGKFLPDISVVNQRTKKRTITNDSGAYTIAASQGDSLHVNGVGFVIRIILVNGNGPIDISLESLTNKLDEVIVVGYGTQRKEAVTGSVATLKGDALRDVPTANVSQSLQGRLAGIQISQTSTQPGATMQIRIRGVRSLSADNNPLIVLDGIPFMGSLADLSPNDIKSVDVLKDASATAIYGSRGANGVVLITTNKGQKGSKPRISYNPYFANQVAFAHYPMMNGPEFVALRKAAGIYSNGLDENDSANVDWQKLLLRTGTINSHDINLSGSSNTGSYNVGLGYYRNQGIIPTQRYTRYSLRTSIDQNVSKYFHFGFTTNSNYNITEGGQLGIGNVVGLSPIADIYNTDGSLKRTVKTSLGESFVLTRGIVEKLHDDGQWINETRNFASYNSMFGEVKIPWIEGLKYRLNLGLDFIQGNSGNYTGEGVNNINPTTVSTAGISNSQTYHWTIENIVTYDKKIADKHSINFTGLYSNERNKYNSSSMSAMDIPADAFQFYNIGQANGQITVDPNNQSYTLWGLTSWMGRLMYSYENKYMISGTLRSDGSSRLAPGHKWHTYPAVSVGWNVVNESFMKSVTWINELKLRAGYGQTSNQAIAPYATLGNLTTSPYNFGNSDYETGVYVSQLPNANLGWEYSETMNYGIDFSLLSGRISGTVEYYTTKTKNLLQSVNLPSTTGVGSYTANVGQTQNKGLEITLNGCLISNPNGFSLDLGANLYTNRNKITALNNGQTQDVNNLWFVGHPINVIYDYQKIGLWQANDPYMSILEPGTTSKPGMIKVKYTGGYNADGSPMRAIDADDRQILDVNPKFMGGFNIHMSYKGFDLTTVGMFQHGGILVSTLYGSGSYLDNLTTRNNNLKVDYWTPTNTGAAFPNPAGPLSGDNPKYASTLGYFDGSYTKIRTITLGYNFNRSLLKSKDLSLRVYFTAQNPFVFSSPYHKFSGMDPETTSYGNQNAAVASYPSRILTQGTTTPTTRNYILGFNLTF